jgi:hypothetical protein
MVEGSWRHAIDREARRVALALQRADCCPMLYSRFGSRRDEKLADVRPDSVLLDGEGGFFDLVYPLADPATDAQLDELMNNKLKRTARQPLLAFGPESLVSVAILMRDECPCIAIMLT